MRQVRVRQEVSRDGGGFVWEGELAGEVGRPPHKQDRPIGQGEGDTGQWLGVKKGLKAGKLENCKRRHVQPVSARRGTAETELWT